MVEQDEHKVRISWLEPWYFDGVDWWFGTITQWIAEND